MSEEEIIKNKGCEVVVGFDSGTERGVLGDLVSKNEVNVFLRSPSPSKVISKRPIFVRINQVSLPVC